MATDKTPKADDFGEPVEAPKAVDQSKTVAEQSLEIEALRRQIAQLSSKPAAESYVQPGDPNETFIGRGFIKGGKFVSDDSDDASDIYYYRIDLAPCGGTDVRLSGETFFHGEAYMVTVDQLRTLREIANRTWGHEQQINGSNENFYRKATNRQLRGSGR